MFGAKKHGCMILPLVHTSSIIAVLELFVVAFLVPSVLVVSGNRYFQWWLFWTENAIFTSGYLKATVNGNIMVFLTNRQRKCIFQSRFSLFSRE
jgi:hypothetical protein